MKKANFKVLLLLIIIALGETRPSEDKDSVGDIFHNIFNFGGRKFNTGFVTEEAPKSEPESGQSVSNGHWMGNLWARGMIENIAQHNKSSGKDSAGEKMGRIRVYEDQFSVSDDGKNVHEHAKGHNSVLHTKKSPGMDVAPCTESPLQGKAVTESSNEEIHKETNNVDSFDGDSLKDINLDAEIITAVTELMKSSSYSEPSDVEVATDTVPKPTEQSAVEHNEELSSSPNDPVTVIATVQSITPDAARPDLERRTPTPTTSMDVGAIPQEAESSTITMKSINLDQQLVEKEEEMVPDNQSNISQERESADNAEEDISINPRGLDSRAMSFATPKLASLIVIIITTAIAI